MTAHVVQVYLVKLWMLNQPRQRWDPQCLIYQNQTVPQVPSTGVTDIPMHTSKVMILGLGQIEGAYFFSLL